MMATKRRIFLRSLCYARVIGFRIVLGVNTSTFNVHFRSTILSASAAKCSLAQIEDAMRTVRCSLVPKVSAEKLAVAFARHNGMSIGSYS